MKIVIEITREEVLRSGGFDRYAPDVIGRVALALLKKFTQTDYHYSDYVREVGTGDPVTEEDIDSIPDKGYILESENGYEFNVKD